MSSVSCQRQSQVGASGSKRQNSYESSSQPPRFVSRKTSARRPTIPGIATLAVSLRGAWLVGCVVCSQIPVFGRGNSWCRRTCPSGVERPLDSLDWPLSVLARSSLDAASPLSHSSLSRQNPADRATFRGDRHGGPPQHCQIACPPPCSLGTPVRLVGHPLERLAIRSASWTAHVTLWLLGQKSHRDAHQQNCLRCRGSPPARPTLEHKLSVQPLAPRLPSPPVRPVPQRSIRIALMSFAADRLV